MLPTVLEQMAVPSIKPERLMKRLDKNIDRVKGQIKTYLVDSNEENIHDLRTSLRKFDASFRLLPKEIRKDSSNAKGQECYRSLFKLNSQIRDMDIMRSKFARYPKNLASRYPDFLEELNENRNKKLSEARVMALSAYEIRPFRIKKRDIAKNQLQCRYEYVIAKFVKEINYFFPLVTSNPTKHSELHELRKDCKKIRYVLEAVGLSNKSKKKVKGAIGLLEEIQNSLGEIHDCDIMLLHLARGRGSFHSRGVIANEAGTRDYSDLMDMEHSERTKLYHQFVARYGDGPAKQDGMTLLQNEHVS